MQSTWFGQFKAMMYKVLLLKRRNFKTTLYEFILPIYFIVILVIIRLTSQGDPLGQFGNFPNYSLYDSIFHHGIDNKNLLVSPDTAEVVKLMTNVKQLILDKTNQTVNIEYFANSTAAQKAYESNTTKVFAGVVFNYNNGSNLTYALRFADGALPSTDMGNLYTGQGGCRWKIDGVQKNNEGLLSDGSCPVNKYLFNAFSILQTSIDTALIQEETGVSSFSVPDVLVQMLPKAAFLQDSSYIQIISSMYFVIAYSPLIAMLTVALVVEKEKKIKEGMRMMGLRSSVFWLAYFLVYIVLIIAITAIVTIIAVAAKFFQNSNAFLFFILLVLYGVSIIALAFLFTPFFNKATTAGGLASLSTMLVSTLYLIVSLTRTVDEGTGSVSYTVPVYGRWLLCLMSPVALALGIDQAIFLDLRGGMTFETASDGEFPLYAPIIMLLLDGLLYFALAVYLDNVIPGEYGPRQKPWFIFTKAFWFPATRDKETAVAFSNQVMLQIDGHTEEVREGAEVEPVPASMESKVAITITNLTKTFQVKKEKKNETIKAVNGLSLTIYQDQITAILGHNGAGKTTLLNILTGMTGATSGSARVLGLDVSDAQDIETMRRMTGICPQHNILFDDFTCLEHLRIFAGIKGIEKDQVEKEINAALDSVGLKDQKNTISKKLSGGQKRKLSVAIAVLGDPKIIILDEPTAGMDPYSRRHLWAILKEKKKGRIILLTTHFMDEADILTDRKAIVNKGTLRCCGSSLFLKNRFGLGYHLNMVVEPDSDTQKISSLVSGIVTGSEINRIHGKELDITLPYDGVGKFSELFSVLENPSTAQSLGVKNFGVSMTTLEEVFLRLEEDIDIELNEVRNGDNSNDSTKLLPLPHKSGNYGAERELHEDNPSDTVKCVEGHTLFMQRFRALSFLRAKKFLVTGPYVFTQLILPVIFLIVSLVLSKTLQPAAQTVKQQSPLNISPYLYTKLKVATNQYFPYNTVPRLLIRDTVNSSLSRSMIGNLSTVYEVDEYGESYYSDMFKLLNQGISPHYLGAEFDTLAQTGQGIDATYKVMYNDSAIHSIPATIALVNNFLLFGVEMIVQGAADFSKSIEVSSWPWPKTSFDDKVYNGASFAMVLLLGMCFCYIPGGMAVDPVKDRELKIRSQLRVSGLPFTLYWLTFFAVDFVKFFIPVILSIIAVFAFQVPSLMYGGAAFSFLLVCFFFIPSNILFGYVFSFLFDKFETCQSIAPTLFLMMGYVPYIPVSIIDMVGNPDTARVMHYIFSFLIPPYNIFGGVYYIDRIYQRASWINQDSSIEFGDYFKMSSNIPICYLTSILHVVLFFFLLRVLDISKTGGDVREACFPGKQKTSVIPSTNNDIVDMEDEDVAAERERVSKMSVQSASELPVAIAENLRKEFKKDDDEAKCKGFRQVKSEGSVKVAVRNQTFAVEAGEVFGLLGPNGAGKTTTLNMMIADVNPDKGKVILGGYDIRSSMSQAFQAMGYCPQHDALWLEMSLKDHLDCYAHTRGIPADLVPEVTNFFIDNLKLQEHKTKKAKDLSGGTKRKLSYCMSMLGRPKIVLFDEPSTGMDPQSKRFLWDTISNSFENSDRGAILTTHYMEEADALCSRIAIMVNGKMECLGSSQHLKSKYGSGYSLEVKLSTEETDEDEALRPKMERLHGYIRQLFPEAVVTEQFSERVQYKIPKSNVETLSRTFTVLEQGKSEYGIAEYSFSQSTLEQVFLEFAKQQLEEGQSQEEDGVERTKSMMRSMSLDSPKHTTSVRI